MVINYVTGNDLKVKLAQQIYNDLNIEIIKKNIETPEIQSLDCEEVSKYSAKYAANLLDYPIIKNDSGLYIDALKGFPGALSKYAEDTITAEGYIKLLEGIENRNCYWLEVLSYCEPGGEPQSFTSKTEGVIATEVHEGRGYDFDKIFIPKGENRTFSEMSEEEQLNYFDNEAYLKLFSYLKEKSE